LRNLPIGDNDRILNFEDFTGSTGIGEEGRIDLRIAGDGDAGGEIARTCLDAGALACIVGAGSCLIEPRIVYRPPWSFDPRLLVRWKLLAEASESLSYVGSGAATCLAAGILCGLGLDATAAGGMFLFWSAPRGGLVSTGPILYRDAAKPIPGAGDVSADRMLFRICGCALEEVSGAPRILDRIVDPICGAACEVVFVPPRMVFFI
jgi:hypothetical protein